MKTSAPTRELARLRAQLETARADLQSERHKVAAHGAEIQRLERLLRDAENRASAAAIPTVTVTHDREKAPGIRGGTCWHLRIGDKDNGISPHIHVNCYSDPDAVTDRSRLRVCEVWIELDDRDRHTVGGGMADAAATFMSISLQCHQDLEALAWKLVGLRGGPGGPVWVRADPPEVMSYEQELAHKRTYVRDREVSSCTSLLDLLGKKLLVRFCRHDPFASRELDDTEPAKVGGAAW